METRQVDVAIIGAGSAGLNASREAHRAGVDWVIIDPGPYGTTCARVGCMPSKLLISAADRARLVDDAGAMGIEVSGWQVDGRAVLERVRYERDRFVGGVLKTLDAFGDERMIRGQARFVGPSSLVVDDALRVEAGAIVVATGSRPWVPPQLDAVQDEVMVSDDVFEMEDLPESIAVFGTGAIGLELGQALGHLGVAVEFFNPTDDIGGFRDPEMVAETHKVFGDSLTLHMRSEVTEVAKVDDGFRIRWKDASGDAHEKVFERILSAAGRRINVESLDLDKAGVPLDQHGRPVSNPRTLQCGDKPVFVAGDVSGHRPILHEAADEGRIAGANAARFPDVRATIRKTRLEIAFTWPQMAIVGERYSELDPEAIAVGEVSFENQGRARVIQQNRGLVRLYAEKAGCRLVGAEMFGPGMEHMAHLVAWSIGTGETVQELLDKPVYHPVLEEGLRTGLRDLARNLRVIEQCPPQTRGQGPGA